MKRNSPLTQDNEMDLLEFIKKLWKEKLLIISVSLLFMLIGYVYAVFQPKIYKTTILLREAPAYLFENYRGLLKSESEISYESKFNNEFKLRLSSLDTLDRFIEKNNKIDEFKFNLKEKNIDIRKLFNGEVETIVDAKKIFLHQYTLTFKEYSPGDQFLNDFIIFVKQEAETTFKMEISKKIISDINLYKENLEIAKKINLENPNMLNSSADASLLFSRGEKVLNLQIMNLNRILNETRELKLDYDPVLTHSKSSVIILKSPLEFAVIAFLLGLLISIVIIFMQFSLQNRD